MDGNFLYDSFITEFDEDFNVIRNIKSSKIDISKYQWHIFKPKIYKKNEYQTPDLLVLNSNFDVNRIKTLYSNLTALIFLNS